MVNLRVNSKKMNMFKRCINKIILLFFYLSTRMSYFVLYILAKRNLIIDISDKLSKPSYLENKFFKCLIWQKSDWQDAFQRVLLLRPAKEKLEIAHTYQGYNKLDRFPEARKGDLVAWHFPVINNGNGKATIYLIQAGFFSSINHAMQNAYLCTLKGVVPYFKWTNSLFVDPELGPNAWKYFFKQPKNLPLLAKHTPDPGLILRNKILFREDGKPIHFDNLDMYIPLPPANIPIAHQIVKHFYTDLILPDTQQLTSDISVDGHVGLHVRSPIMFGRKRWSREQLPKLTNQVPINSYLEKIEQALKHPAATSGKVFLATDSEQIVEMFMKILPGMVVNSSVFRTKKGEFHHARPISGYQMGLDIIKEVELLSRCAILVHGESSISTFLKCLCPDQPCLNIYEKLYPTEY